MRMEKHPSLVFEHFDDLFICILDKLPFEIGNFTCEFSIEIDRAHNFNLRTRTSIKINFTKSGSHIRDGEVCNLRWEWELKVPELGTSVFIIPGGFVKNGLDRLVVLNSVARSIVEARRGKHSIYVFTYSGKPLERMLNSAWRKARVRANLPTIRVHDLKHTFGRRLRAAGVSFEDRQDLLGHKSARIATTTTQGLIFHV